MVNRCAEPRRDADKFKYDQSYSIGIRDYHGPRHSKGKSDAMWSAISLISIVLGVSTATIAQRQPAYNDFLETSAGVLLIGGLLLLGSSLPVLL